MYLKMLKNVVIYFQCVFFLNMRDNPKCIVFNANIQFFRLACCITTRETRLKLLKEQNFSRHYDFFSRNRLV